MACFREDGLGESASDLPAPAIFSYMLRYSVCHGALFWCPVGLVVSMQKWDFRKVLKNKTDFHIHTRLPLCAHYRLSFFLAYESDSDLTEPFQRFEKSFLL